jgi:ribosomal-protein-serine acetyltransferase
MIFANYTIRLLSIQDLDAYFQLVEQNRERLEDFFTGTVSRTRTVEDTRVFLGDITQRAMDRAYFPYIIVDTTNNKIAGFIDLKILIGISRNQN